MTAIEDTEELELPEPIEPDDAEPLDDPEWLADRAADRYERTVLFR